MPPRRRAERDPREPLVRLVERLSQRRQFVTLADLERAAWTERERAACGEEVDQ